MNISIIASALSLIVTIHAFGQGIGVFEASNVGPIEAGHIYVGEYLGPVKAEGDAYKIAIFWGPSGTTDENSLVQIGSTMSFLTAGGAGQFSGSGRTIFDP